MSGKDKKCNVMLFIVCNMYISVCIHSHFNILSMNTLSDIRITTTKIIQVRTITRASVSVFMPWYSPTLVKSISILLSYIFYYFSTTECILLYSSRTDDEVHAAFYFPFSHVWLRMCVCVRKSVYVFG